jgi:lysine 2,3-aminomutase
MSDDRRFEGSPAVATSEVARRLGLPGLDKGRRGAARQFPVRFTDYYLGLVDPRDPADPIRRIAFPEPAELEADTGALDDPVGERAKSPVPFVVRKHPDRAILLVSSRCHVYCRFCFRRAFPDGAHRDPTPAELDAAIDWLADRTELREVILSGGDPLVLPDAELRRIVERLSALPRLERLRVHTRAPVHDPARVTPALASALASGLPMWVVLHFDHPREVTCEARAAIDVLRAAGLPVLNQSVLLAGVNDDAATLEALCRALVGARVKPYYLHHPDRVQGGGSFYVEIERGLALYRELRQRLGGGLALPAYVIDLPDGSGKVPVEEWGQVSNLSVSES